MSVEVFAEIAPLEDDLVKYNFAVFFLSKFTLKNEHADGSKSTDLATVMLLYLNNIAKCLEHHHFIAITTVQLITDLRIQESLTSESVTDWFNQPADRSMTAQNNPLFLAFVDRVEQAWEEFTAIQN